MGLAVRQDDFSLMVRHASQYALLLRYPAFASVPAVAFARRYVTVEAVQQALMVLIALVALAAVWPAVRASAQIVRERLEVAPLLR